MKYFTKMHIALVRVILIAATIVMLGGYPSTLYAASELPYTFSPGQTISSAQVNANFQALSAQITALQAQLTPASPTVPVSFAGIYDYFLFDTGMRVVQYNLYDQGYRIGRTNYQGTLVISDNGTARFSGTGGYTEMEIRNVVYHPDPNSELYKLSAVSGTTYTSDPTDSGEAPYTVNGSTITVAGGVFVGTLSSDGKIFAGISNSDRGTGIMMGIRRPPAITSATSTTADGHYNAGATISVTLNFSEAVTSAGLTIALNSGAAITTEAINNATSWSGTYTVGTGETSSDLSISTITGAITSDLSVFSTSNPIIPEGQNIGDSSAIVIE